MDLEHDDFDFHVEEEDFTVFKRAFEIFDKDKSGKISAEELDKLILELSDTDPTDEELQQLMKEFDSDGDGNVEFQEFVRVMAIKAENERIAKKEEEYRQAFQVFDRDGDGKVSAQELKLALTKSGNMKLTDEQVEEMIAAVDVDQDGMLSYEELVCMFTGRDSVKSMVKTKSIEED